MWLLAATLMFANDAPWQDSFEETPIVRALGEQDWSRF